MRFLIGFKIHIVFAIVFLSSGIAVAQDTTKKAAMVSKPVVTKSATNTAPVAAKSGIPINPKTGRPYTKWGYGANAKTYQAQKKADSLIKNDTTKPLSTAAVTPVVTDKSLNGQYQYLLTKVYNYQQPFIAAFWKNVRDSLNGSRQQLKAANEKLAASSQSVSQLKSDVSASQNELSDADSVDFFGISFSKNGYSTMMWSLVAVLGGLAAIVIFRSGSARSEATYRTKLYADLEEEFKTYKAKANEKEKKLARELQTERNKVDELMGRG
jgi:hypothetical protein